ncbi:MAG: DEAD/DEAH box helicase [Cytophagales bacterium]|nr:DEAD/DEAH box helicase [Cytophagales bacterium]
MKDIQSSKLSHHIINVLQDKGIQKFTPVQEKAIPVLLKHDGDFVGQAPTGTGKTYAYGAPLLTRIDAQKGQIQAVVLVPTRELCEQVGQELTFLGQDIEGLKVEAIYGGLSVKEQIQKLSQGVQVVVATPGRLLDLIDKRVVYLSKINFLVLDEADEMLLKGFREDIDRILEKTNEHYQTWLFSATMPTGVNRIIKNYLQKNLEEVFLTENDDVKTNENIEHWMIELHAEEKLNILLHFLTRFGNDKGVIFCRTKSGVQKLYKQLSAHKFKCGAVHGDLPQGLRNKVMEQYKEGSINLLLATDVAARGVDVDGLSFVIQYHIAGTAEMYLHRSGRTSRAGKSGVCLTFVFPEERDKFIEIKKELKFKLKTLPRPSVKDQLFNKAILWSRKVAKSKPVSYDKLSAEEKDLFKKELEHLSKDEIMERMLAVYLREQQG